MGKVILVTGGARSGKSTFALKTASSYSKKRLFLATAVAFDNEMKERIAKHQAERGALLDTIEEPYDPGLIVRSLGPAIKVVLLDCLTVWLGNLMYRHEDNLSEIRNVTRKFIELLGKNPFDLIIVTNEVGWGIVPENPSSRLFRDLAGSLNQEIAGKADEVYLCACGIPVRIKDKGHV